MKLTNNVGQSLDEADEVAVEGNRSLIHNEAFEKLESLRRKNSQLDYDQELESYRDEKYSITSSG